MGGGRSSSRLWGWAIGAVATLLVCAALVAGWFERLDGYNLDLHFRHCNRLQADPRIVVIAIDDSTLRVMPDWPWPRRVFADLVRTLDEFEPKTIVLDFIFDLPATPRIEHAGLTNSHGFDDVVTIQGDPKREEIIYDDKELATALTESGNVFLATTAPLYPMHSLDDVGRHQARLEMTALNEDLPTWETYFQRIHGDALIDAVTPDRQYSLRKYRQLAAKKVLYDRLDPVDPDTQSRLLSAIHVVAPLESFSRTAKGAGLASLAHRESQSVVREIPLVAEYGGKLLPQLGVAAVTDYLDSKLSVTSSGQLRMRLVGGDQGWSVPVGPSGLSLVNWYAPPGFPAWLHMFKQYPASIFLEIVENRRAIGGNRTSLGVALGDLIRVRHADTPAAYDDYAKRINLRIESPGAIHPVDPVIELVERESIEWLKRAWSLWEKETPRNDEETAEKEKIKRLYDRFGEGQYSALLDSANKKLEERNHEIVRDLSPMLKGKIVLVGYTATAMADMVPTPVDPAMPGVMVHANVVNMFLQNRFASAAGPLVNVLLLLIGSGMTTIAAVAGRTRMSVGVLLVVVAGMLGLGAMIFEDSAYHLSTLSIAVSVCFVWACVTVYRQTTDERSRRKLQRALAQYTSPAVAARIAEQARADTLAPRTARISCFFSDLSGFTALSERLGPQRTREALDPYLREVSAVIMAQGGMVNKFLGDGVFAFFNAPILPCAIHAAAACESALRAAASLHRVVGGPNLAIRIGVSTGDAFVGDYGSEQKLDYTCIGDTVNVAQRLERGNKFLSTAILVDDATRKAAGEGFVFRSLGRLAVAGRANPVDAHELLARSPADPALVEGIARFEEAVRYFQTCQWGRCLSILAELRRLDPKDAAAECYHRAAERFQTQPPPVEWNGAIDVSTV